MSDTPTPNAQGTTTDNGKPGDPIAELRQRHAEAVSRGPVSRNGVKPGTIRGPYKKHTPGPGPAAISEPIRPPRVEPAGNENLNKKMGQVWRSVGYGLSLGTNCNVWLLDQEQEKLLGEAYGDLCAHFGLADTLAFKMVFAVGTTVGIMGAKAAVYATYRADLLAKQEKANKELKTEPQNPPAKPEDPGAIHETKPGLL